MCRAQELLSSALLRAPAVLHSLLSHARHVIFSGSTFLFFGLVLVYNRLRGGAGGRAGAGARARTGSVAHADALGSGLCLWVWRPRPRARPRYRDSYR